MTTKSRVYFNLHPSGLDETFLPEGWKSNHDLSRVPSLAKKVKISAEYSWHFLETDSCTLLKQTYMTIKIYDFILALKNKNIFTKHRIFHFKIVTVFMNQKGKISSDFGATSLLPPTQSRCGQMCRRCRHSTVFF